MVGAVHLRHATVWQDLNRPGDWSQLPRPKQLAATLHRVAAFVFGQPVVAGIGYPGWLA